MDFNIKTTQNKISFLFVLLKYAPNTYWWNTNFESRIMLIIND
jgi:hypothetical protein